MKDIAAISIALVSAVIASCSTEPAKTSSSRQITATRAHELAALYMGRYISLCGTAQEPVRYEISWEVPIVTGVGAEPSGSIRVDRRTGVVSYPGKPTVIAKELDDWLNSLPNGPPYRP